MLAKVRASLMTLKQQNYLILIQIRFYFTHSHWINAGLAGITVAPILGVEPGMDMEV